MSGFGARNVQLERRGEWVFEQIVETGSVVIKTIGGDRAGEIGAHRFLEAQDVSVGSICNHFAERTAVACANQRIVVAQDTTEINFAGRDKARTGLGPAGAAGSTVGFFMHAGIAIDVASEALLGLATLQIWTRDDCPASDRRKRTLEDKESYRWLETGNAAADVLGGAQQIIMVADREGDIYSHFARHRPQVDLIVRVAQNRNTLSDDETTMGLFARLDELAPLGTDTVDVIPRRIGEKPRTATVAIRAGRFRLARPHNGASRDDPAAFEINVVEAREIDAAGVREPLLWRLVTTLPVATLAEANDVVGLYRLRWRIEEVFRVLKADGVKLEDSQMQGAGKLFKLAALALAAAVRIIQLRDARDGSPRPASDVIEADDVAAVEMIGKTLEGRTKRQQNHHQAGSLAWLAWIVARLGGWNCYYKPPGPKTMAAGWKKLATMLTAIKIATDAQQDMKV